MQQHIPTRMTTVPWKQIGFEVFLLTNFLVKLESTMYMVGMGSLSMAREGGMITGVTASTGLHLESPWRPKQCWLLVVLAPGPKLPSDSGWSQTAPSYASALLCQHPLMPAPTHSSTLLWQRWQQAVLAIGSTGNRQCWQQPAMAMANTQTGPGCTWVTGSAPPHTHTQGEA